MSVAAGSLASAPVDPSSSSASKPQRRGVGRRPEHWWTPWMFAIPGLALFLFTTGYPLIRSLQISFFNWSVVPSRASEFIGLANYTRALHDPQFWVAVTNAGFYLVVTVPLTVAIGLFFAVMLNGFMPGRTLFRVLFYIPVVTGWVVVSLLFKYLFTTDNGAVNWFLNDILNLTGNIPWLEQRWTALLAISILGIWKNLGWCLVVFLAALSGVSEDLYEAAALDGANGWQRFIHVTVPGIRGSLMFVVVLQVIGAFNVFPSVLLMTDGGPAGTTEVPLTYMYKQAFSYLDFGYGAAMSFIMALFIFAISWIQFRVFREEKEPTR